MNRWTRDEALIWSRTYGVEEGLAPDGNQMAMDALDREVRRLHNRVERLRGLCKTASGWLLDVGRLKEADEVLRLVGDMEKPLP